MEYDKKNPLFPSDFISPEEKATKEYSLKWCEAMENVGLIGENNGFYRGTIDGVNKYFIWRGYARGQQSIDKYKPVMGIKDKKTRKDPNALDYMVLNWEILDVASKYVNVLIGKLLKQNNDIGIQAVDKRAQDDRRVKRMQFQEFIVNKPFLDSVSDQTGIQFEGPVQEDVIPPPTNLGEIDMFMEMFYKEDYCMVIQDLLKIMNESDNYNDILADIARNLVEISTAATKVYRVGNKIRKRSCNPDRMAMSSTQKNMCDDAKWVYEDWDLTIGQFKEIAGDQLTEAQYREIAETVSKANWNDVDVSAYYSQNMCYPWDSTKITVKDAVWFSPDWETHKVKKNEIGNINVYQESYAWWKDIQDKGGSVESYNKKNPGSEVMRYCIDNQYQALYVIGTKHVVNYGKSKDMLKNESSLGKTVGPYCIYKLKKCIMESIIPTLDNIQINWLQYQHHAAKSRPAGLDIEFSALQDISLDGAGGARMKPKDVLRLYFETGILLWRRKGADGQNSNWRPIQEMQNGMSPAMTAHFQNVLNDINLLRDQVGLNEMTDASTPNSEMGKAVAMMASGGTDDALRSIFVAFDQLNLGTHERMVMHVSGMAATGLAPEYTEALGLRSMAVMGLLSDLTHHQLGCYLLKLPSPEIKARIAMYVQEGIKTGWLYPEEAIEVEMEPNIYRSIRLLKMYKAQKQAAQAAQTSKDIQENAMAQQQSATAKAQADAQMAEEDRQGQANLAWEQARAKAWSDKQDIGNQVFLANVQSQLAKGEALTAEQERRMTEMMKVDRQGEWNVRVQQSKPKPKATSSGKR